MGFAGVGQGRRAVANAVHTVKIAFADQGYTCDEPAQAARDAGMDLQMIKPPATKKGFALLPRRWVVERSFGWLNRVRRLARDYARLPGILSGLHFVVFAMLMLVHLSPSATTRGWANRPFLFVTIPHGIPAHPVPRASRRRAAEMLVAVQAPLSPLPPSKLQKPQCPLAASSGPWRPGKSHSLAATGDAP